MVSNWVLNKFHPTDKGYIDKAFDLFSLNFDTLCNQEFSKLQKTLHTK
jgi:peptidyl-tRNA hydrolase